MLRTVDTEPEMTKFASGSTGSSIRNCAFRNTDGTALEMWGGQILLIIVTLIKLIILLLITVA
jgi:hypothetical protein